MINRFTSINIKNDGEPVAICAPYNGKFDLSRVGLIAIHSNGIEKTYQLNCYNVRPFSRIPIKKYPEIEAVVGKILESESKSSTIETINNGRGLKLYFDGVYSGLITLGRRYDDRTIWDPNFRELVDIDFLELKLQRYSSEAKPDFEKIKQYLDERNRQAIEKVRRSA